MRANALIAFSLLLGGTTYGLAQTSHGGMDHAEHTPSMRHGSGSAVAAPVSNATSVLSEPGQDAFAALSEVVRVLEADPTTDWSKVDLMGLREHLRDMDRLVGDAVVSTTALPDGLRMSITGDAETVAAVRRMVPAHAAELAKDERWSVVATTTDEGAELTVKSADPSVVARIKGLGFFGLMASQDHHREHHYAMARGGDAHAH